MTIIINATVAFPCRQAKYRVSFCRQASLSANQINYATLAVSGVIVNYLSALDCPYCDSYHQLVLDEILYSPLNNETDTEITKINDDSEDENESGDDSEDGDDSGDENEDGDNSSIIDLINTSVNYISVEVDSHWDCCCKTSKVCGCGCDPLHDGW